MPLKTEGGTGLPPGVTVENQIVVNGATYRSADEMPPEVREVYLEAMSRVRRGGGLSVTREGPSLSIGYSWGARPSSLPAPPEAPPAIGPSATESGLRTLLVVVALVVIGGLAVLALAGR